MTMVLMADDTKYITQTYNQITDALGIDEDNLVDILAASLLDPIKFRYTFFDRQPHPAQDVILRDRYQFKTISAGRRFGKSVLMADDINWYAIRYPGTIQFGFAPTYDQTRIIFTEAVDQMSKSLLNPLVTHVIKTPFPRIEYSNGSVIEFRSTKTPENIRGRKAHRAILDEAAFIQDDVVSSVIEPMLMDYNGGYIKISTPFGTSNHFYKTFVNGSHNDDNPWGTNVKGFKSYHFTSYDNPHISHDYLKSKAAEYGEDSIVFRTEYLGEFIDDQNSVFAYKDIMGNIDTSINVLPVIDKVNEIYPTGLIYHKYVIGLDIAKHRDYTVILAIDTSTYPYQVVYLNRFNKRPYQTIVDEVILLKQLLNDADIIMDSTGVGDPLFEQLETYGAYGYQITNTSKLHLIEALQKAMQNTNIKRADIRYPPIPALIKELQFFEYNLSQKSNRITMAAKLGYHDDIVIALALAVYGITQAGDLGKLVNVEDWTFS